VAARAREGEALRADLHARLSAIEAVQHDLGTLTAEAPDHYRKKLRDRLERALKPGELDPQRLAQEIAILADRLDVQEELSRFRAHIAAFRAALGAPQPDGVGKRLGFLLQEMLREANTTGSKGNDAAIVSDVLLVKEELERMREQVENLE